MTAIRIFWLMVRLGVLNELQYRVNFFLQIFQSVLQLGTALVGLGIVFTHTETNSEFRTHSQARVQ